MSRRLTQESYLWGFGMILLKARSSLFCVFFLLFGLSAHTKAETHDAAPLLSDVITVPFKPVTIRWLLMYEDNVSELVEAAVHEVVERDGYSLQWSILSAVELNASRLPVWYSLILEGKETVKVLPPVERARASIVANDLTLLERRRSELTTDIDTVQKDIVEMHRTIRDLKKDLERIADIDKIVAIREKRNKEELMLVSLQAEIKTLQESLKLVKERKVPQGYLSQEVQLTGTLSEYIRSQGKGRKQEQRRGH